MMTAFLIHINAKINLTCCLPVTVIICVVSFMQLQLLVLVFGNYLMHGVQLCIVQAVTR